MGIYIKGQKMPETCNDCEFLDLDTFDYEMHIACGLTGEIVTYDLRHGRNENCPLIEVTEPHGRLIDADTLKDKVLKWMPSDPCGIEEREFPFETDIVASLLMEIDDEPTVIEAEGE